MARRVMDDGHAQFVHIRGGVMQLRSAAVDRFLRFGTKGDGFQGNV